MKQLTKKRFAAVALCSCLSFMTMGGLQAYAETDSTDMALDHLSVALSADKDEYDINEQIYLNLDIENPHSYAINDLSVNMDLPNHLILKSLEIPDNKTMLNAGEHITAHAVVAVQADGEEGTSIQSTTTTNATTTNSAIETTTISSSATTAKTTASSTTQVRSDGNVKTGDEGVYGTVIVLLAAFSVAFFTAKKKKSVNRLFSILLCALILANYMPASAIKVNAADIPEVLGDVVKSQTSISVNNVSYDIEAVVSFSFGFRDAVDEYEMDTDSDGLPDSMEKQLGLNPNNADTDNDKLTDYFEYCNVVSDPQIADTDDNGISDYDEDSDEDGLKNGDEQIASTYAFNKDSDDDGLTDGDEVHKYSTDPTKKDTDGDGLTDYEEVMLGLNPLKTSSDGSVNDSERKIPQTASDEVKDTALIESDNWLVPQLSGNVVGLLDNQVSMSKDESMSFNDNHSILSDVIGIESSCSSALNLEFTFKEKYTGNPDQLVIAYYDNDAHELHLVDSQLSDAQDKLEGEITSSGYYFVMDIDEFLKSIGIDVMNNLAETTEEISTKSYMAPLMFAPKVMAASAGSSIGKADIVFVVDTTGSMSDAIYNVQENINTFAEKMSNEYHVDMNYSLIEYRDIEEDGVDSTVAHNNLSSRWFTNVNTFKSEVSNLTVDGGGDAPETPIDALELARTSNWRNGATRFVVLVTDVYSKNDNTSEIENMDEMAQKFAADGIVVSVITDYRADYANLLDQTHGLYGDIYSDFSDILLQLAGIIGTETHEGGDWIILDDYSIVQLKGSVDDIATLDSDEDELKDSEELITKSTVDVTFLIEAALFIHGVPLERYHGKTQIEMWSFKSNPTMPDTDHDDILDRFDLKPRNWNYYPETFVNYINSSVISMETMQKTGDGFYICNTSVADMLNNCGVTSISDGETNRSVQSFFDDWYLFAVKDSSITYGLCKMREQENDSSTGDNDDPGVTISFVAFDTSKLTNALTNHVNNNDLWEEINKVVLTGNSHDETLQKYFSNVNSDASYLIGELFAKKIASYSSNNRINLPNKFNDILDDIAEIDETIRVLSRIPTDNNSDIAYMYVQRGKLRRVPDALEQINSNASSKIYYEDERYLQLADASNISKNEQLAILAAFTSDISLNMFAAEVKFHADALVNWKSFLNKWYSAAIRADMAIGEEYESGLYDDYYDPNSSLVQEQVNAHGEQ